MRHRLSLFSLFVWLLVAGRADAQFNVAEPAPGEDFVVELGLMFWKPTPELRVQTGALAAIGEPNVDLVQEFGIEDKRFTEFRAVLKAGGKHKLRVSFVSMQYQADAVLQRTVTLGGRTFSANLPATADLTWDLWRVGYEWDVVAADRGLFGFILEMKHNKVSATLSSVIGAELTEANAPVPAIGLIGRGYLHRNVSITAEFTGLKLPFGISDRFDATVADFDIYGTASFGRHVGIQGGYRSVVAEYFVDEDTGDLKMKGLYFGGLLRF